MRLLRHFLTPPRRRTWLLLTILLGITIMAIIAACGKLSDDSDRPYTPTGSSGGQTIPMALPDQLGSHSLTLTASDDQIPADGVTFTNLSAKLAESSGMSVEHYIVNFNTTPQSDAICLFLNPATTVGTGSPAITTTGRTSAGGGVSVRLYGVMSGSCVVQASVDINADGLDDLFKTVVVVTTPAGPPSEAGSYQLELTADPSVIPDGTLSESVITAKLVDRSGGSVENIAITFAEPATATTLGFFETSGQTTYTGITNQNGEVSVRFFGETIGTALIQASVFVSDLVGTLQNTVAVDILSQDEFPDLESIFPYAFAVMSEESSIPADGVTDTRVYGELVNLDGDSVEDYAVTFTVAQISDQICQFLIPGALPGLPGSYTGTTTALTDESGIASVRLYGMQAGSCTIQSSVLISTELDTTIDRTLAVTVTAGPGAPGPDVAGVALTTLTPHQAESAGECGKTDPVDFTYALKAQVWDEGGRLSYGTRVELSGDISTATEHFGSTGSDGSITFTYTWTVGCVCTIDWDITATAIVNGVTYTDTITISATTTCTVPDED